MRRWAIPGSIGVSVSVLAIAIAARTARADPPQPTPSAVPVFRLPPRSRPALAAPPPGASTPPPPALTTAVVSPGGAVAPPRKVHPRRPKTPELPPPSAQLTVDAPSPDGPWTMRAENTGSIPVRIVADARLLAFDLAPGEDDDDDPPAVRRRTARPVRCQLPVDMRPSDDEERALVLPPGRSYAAKLDPRLFCFGARNSRALVAGAKVTPHMIGARELNVVEPIEEVEPKVASVRDWSGTPTTIGPAAAGPSKDAVAADALAVTTNSFADFGLGWEVEVTVTVTNKSPQSTSLLFRPETLAFDVTGPSGVDVTDPSPTVHCAWPGLPPPPISEAYTRLAPKQSASMSVLLSALCPEDTMKHPGLFFVRATLDTRRASGASIGIHTFVGTVLGGAATRVRVRDWGGPPPPAPRPQLVEAVPAQPSP
jgi:hypothetical protein